MLPQKLSAATTEIRPPGALATWTRPAPHAAEAAPATTTAIDPASQRRVPTPQRYSEIGSHYNLFENCSQLFS
jgi:hypothetical protein